MLQSGAHIALYSDVVVDRAATCLRIKSHLMKLPLRSFPPLNDLTADMDRLLGELARLRNKGTESEIQAATSRATQACMRQVRPALCWQDSYRLATAGNSHWTGGDALNPGEPFAEINEQIVNASPFLHTFFSGYSNGGLDYLPVRSAFEEGGYEVEMCPFSPEAADIVVKECHEMLNELAASGNFKSRGIN